MTTKLVVREQAIQAVEELTQAGWTFEVWAYQPTMTGWWLLKTSTDPIEAMRRGDPKGFHEGALITLALYRSGGHSEAGL